MELSGLSRTARKTSVLGRRTPHRAARAGALSWDTPGVLQGRGGEPRGPEVSMEPADGPFRQETERADSLEGTGSRTSVEVMEVPGRGNRWAGFEQEGHAISRIKAKQSR